LGVHGVGLGRIQSKEGRVEAVHLVQESPATQGCGESARPAPLGRHLANRLPTVGQELPEGFRILDAPREAAGHSDHGDGLGRWIWRRCPGPDLPRGFAGQGRGQFARRGMGPGQDGVHGAAQSALQPLDEFHQRQRVQSQVPQALFGIPAGHPHPGLDP